MALPTDQPLPELSDEQLVELSRNGQSQAFAALLERYRRDLFHYLLRLSRSRATADDLFQETFLQVHQSLESFDTGRRFKPWLFTIATNKFRDWIRKSQRKHAARLSTPLNTGGEDERTVVDLMEADLPSPSDMASRAETRQRVKQAVDELPEHLREVLLLAYFEQLAYKEIAEMLGIPLGTVKSRLHAAVAAFARRWEQEQEEDDAT